jgi:hypothetical protein
VRLAGVNVTLGAAARLAVLVQRNGDMPLATKIGEASHVIAAKSPVAGGING